MQKFFGDNYYREEDDEKPQFDEDFEGEDLFLFLTAAKRSSVSISKVVLVG